MTTPTRHQITPDTPLWFGKYRGTAIRRVPASYLLWLHGSLTESSKHRRPDCQMESLFDYITKNKKEIQETYWRLIDLQGHTSRSYIIADNFHVNIGDMDEDSDYDAAFNATWGDD